MSLVVTVYVPSGIVMAADSRLIVRRTEEREEEGVKVRAEQHLVFSDNSNAVVKLRRVPFGVSTYDAGVINHEPTESHIYRFESEVVEEEDDIDAVADKLLAYFQERHPKVAVGFHIAGYRTLGRTREPVVLVGHTTRETKIRRVNATETGEVQWGVARAGDTTVPNRLIDPKHLPLFAAMPLQDAIDYSIHLIRTTIDTLRFEPRFPTVGGPIDVLVVRPDGPLWIQRKELRGDVRTPKA
jgi:hypothetical protein